MSDVIVVALPKEDDPVNIYSSEKAAHMTILNLGENPDNLQQIVEFVQHAAKTSLPRFTMTVDRRGELGPDNADVLFFEKDVPWCNGVFEFRKFLLGDNAIKLAYDSVEQYPEWTPHLTMGYPETPAKKDERDYPYFYNVQFDRVAVWTEDSDGPTFLLDGDSGLDLAMSDKLEDFLKHQSSTTLGDFVGGHLDKFLAHFGVKGMRWGVRRTDEQLGNPGGGKNGVTSPSGIDIDPSKATSATIKLTRKQREKLGEQGIDSGKTLEVRKDISKDDFQISEDALRFVQTQLKDGAEMSTKEINDALKRAEAVAKYDEHFRKDAHDLAIKEAAAAQARIELAIKETSLKNAQLDFLIKEANVRKANQPKSKLERAKNLIAGINGAYREYEKLSKLSGGLLPDPLDKFRDAAKKASKMSGVDKRKGPALGPQRPTKSELKSAAKKERDRRSDARDKQDSDYARAVLDQQKQRSANATQAVPSRPAPSTVLNPAVTVGVPRGPYGTQYRPGTDTPMYPGYPVVPRIYHEDLSKFIAQFEGKKIKK